MHMILEILVFKSTERNKKRTKTKTERKTEKKKETKNKSTWLEFIDHSVFVKCL